MQNGVHSFTGHRPDKVGGYSPNAQKRLIAYAMDVLVRANTEIAIVGMALGWDQSVADACVILDIPFVAVVPFPRQEGRWPQPSQERYRRLLGQAQDQITLRQNAPMSAMQAAAWLDERNHWMVDESCHLHALWNGDRMGGTANCVAYAALSGREFTNHWDGWAKRGWLPEMFEDLIE